MDKDAQGIGRAEFELRKYEARIGLWKIIFGTVIVGLAGVLIPGAIEYWSLGFQERRAELETIAEQEKNQQDFVSAYVTTALNEDIELRIRFAEYFAAVANDGSVESWNSYLETLREKRKSVREQIDKFEERFRRLSYDLDDNPRIEQQIEIAQVERRLEWLYREIGYVQRGRSIVPSVNERSSELSGTYTTYNQPVIVPDREQVNRDLTVATKAYLVEKLGMPREDLSDKCESLTNPRLQALLRTESVGPIRVRMLAPAVESLQRIFARLRETDPILYSKVGSAGALCVRRIRGTANTLSSHSFGMAVDLKIDARLDTTGDGKSQAGLVKLAELFQAEKWIWGAGFRQEDSMHFEVSKELIEQWLSEGKL